MYPAFMNPSSKSRVRTPAAEVEGERGTNERKRTAPFVFVVGEEVHRDVFERRRRIDDDDDTRDELHRGWKSLNGNDDDASLYPTPLLRTARSLADTTNAQMRILCWGGGGRENEELVERATYLLTEWYVFHIAQRM